MNSKYTGNQYYNNKEKDKLYTKQKEFAALNIIWEIINIVHMSLLPIEQIRTLPRDFYSALRRVVFLKSKMNKIFFKTRYNKSCSYSPTRNILYVYTYQILTIKIS